MEVHILKHNFRKGRTTNLHKRLFLVYTNEFQVKDIWRRVKESQIVVVNISSQLMGKWDAIGDIKVLQANQMKSV